MQKSAEVAACATLPTTAGKAGRRASGPDYQFCNKNELTNDDHGGGISSFGKVHLPTCDFSAMISHDFLVLQREIKMMTH